MYSEGVSPSNRKSPVVRTLSAMASWDSLVYTDISPGWCNTTIVSVYAFVYLSSLFYYLFIVVLITILVVVFLVICLFVLLVVCILIFTFHCFFSCCFWLYMCCKCFPTYIYYILYYIYMCFYLHLVDVLYLSCYL